jgi:hypothetical protein
LRIRTDSTGRSFLFTLKNPDGIRPRKFDLKSNKRRNAIACGAAWGPYFCDIGVSDRCNANSDSFADLLGTHYGSNIGSDMMTFLTGSRHFTVQEIEVFEIRELGVPTTNSHPGW